MVLRLRGAHSDLIPSDIASATDVIVAHRAADPSTPVISRGREAWHMPHGTLATHPTLPLGCTRSRTLVQAPFSLTISPPPTGPSACACVCVTVWLQVALVVEGAALTHALAGSEASFARLLMMCSTVVCCRASPAQKAALVSLVRASGHTALAIGDGGNDCAMIQVLLH